MKQLLKRWRGHRESDADDPRGESTRALEKRRRDGGDALAPWRGPFDTAFERMWHDLAMQPWRAFDMMPDFSGWGADWDKWDWPRVETKEDEKSITLRVEVPGMGAEDVDVEVSGNLLTVRGNRLEEHEEKKRGAYRHERRGGSFVRTVTLPDYADAANVQARYDKGVLTVTVPKVPGKGPRRVTVSG